jgi:hypothetical protein
MLEWKLKRENERYHLATGVAEILEGLDFWVEIAIKTRGRGVNVHDEVGDQVENFSWHVK